MTKATHIDRDVFIKDVMAPWEKAWYATLPSKKARWSYICWLTGKSGRYKDTVVVNHQPSLYDRHIELTYFARSHDEIEVLYRERPSRKARLLLVCS